MARQMKDSGVEWIGKIPEGWLGCSAIQKFIRVDNKNSDLREKNLLSLSYGKIKQKNIETTDGLLPESFDGYNIIEAGDIVLRLTDLQNDQKSLRVGLSKERGIVTSAYLTLRNKFKDCPSFWYYYWHSFDICKGFYGMGAGVRQGLNWDGLKQMRFFAPEHQEQKRIASFLDKKCSAIDDVLVKTQDSIEEYKKLKLAMITEAVTKGIRGKRPMKDSGIDWIGQIPADWSVHKVKRLLFERKDRSELGTEEPLSMSQVYGLIPTKDLESIPNMASSFIGAKLTYSGDLVFNKLKAHLGVFSVSKYDGLVSPDYAVYCATGLADLTYLEFLFRTPQCIHEFKKRITGVGAGLSRLYTGELFSISCAIPPKEEQIEISKYLYGKRAEIDTLISKKQQFIEELTAYKKSLIYEYVTGKKEVPA